MALKKEIQTPYGVADYFRIRSVVLYRDQPGTISGWSEENQPETNIQIDFELYKSDELRKEGALPIPGVRSVTINSDDPLGDELTKKLYELVKMHPLFTDSKSL